MVLQIKRAFAKLLSNSAIGWLVCVIWSSKIPMKRFGLVAAVDNQHMSYVNIAKIFWGIYESAELRILSEMEFPELDIIELGSSIGLVSAALGKKMIEKNRLFLVEGNTNILPLIEQNLVINGYMGKYTIINKAIGYDQQKVKFSLSKNNTESRVIDGNHTSNDTIELPTTRLSDIVYEHKIEDYILVSDIEGAEIEFLLNDESVRFNCKHMIIELHETHFNDKTYTVENLKSIITDMGFKLHRRIGNAFHFIK